VIASLILTFFFGPSVAAAKPDPLASVVVRGVEGAKIDDYMSRLETLGYSGALIVEKNGEIIVHKAYGFADPTEHRKYTIDDAATIGSITKQFTAAAIMTLVQAGKVRVDDPITKYFDNVPDDKKGITLQELLTHSAGFPGAIGDDYDPIGRDDFVRLAMKTPLLFAPGTAYEYSNVGFSLLGAIVEIVSGEPYEKYLHDHLFVPAGMEHTGYRIPKWDPAKLAQGMNGDEKWGTPLDRPWAEDGEPGWHLRANGGIISTTGDMMRWSRALDGEKILTKASKEKMFHPWVREGEDADSFYGYGWAIFPMPDGHRLIAHNGGNGIFAADFRRYVDDGVVVFIQSNIAERPSIAASGYVSRLARGIAVPMPPKVTTLSDDAMKTLVGRYRAEDVEIAVVPAPGGAVELKASDGKALALLAGGGDDPERAARADERSKAVVDAALKDDNGPLTEAFGGIPREEVDRQQKEMLAQMERELGPRRGAAVIGSRPVRGMMATIVRLDFERGSRYLQMMWGPRGFLNGVRVMDALPSFTFHPVSKTELASFDMRSGETRTVTIENGTLAIGDHALKKVKE